ncbi:MAG: D-alanyl-D-alanine carboxypeptidase family protein [Acidimicrobiia bacterium]
MFRAVGALVVGTVLVGATPVAATADSSSRPGQTAGEARAYILVDPASGAVLDAHAEHEALPVAGTIKLVTALTALQRIPNEERVRTTTRAANAPEPTLGMSEGTTWALEDLLQGMLLTSANDAAYALAEGAAGAVDEFAAEMTRVGALMGLADSTFADPAGVDDETAVNGSSSMSAYDLAVVAANVLGAPELMEIVTLLDYRVFTPDGESTALSENVNDFLRTYPGATGMKTGSSAAAGNVVVASAEREGRALIAVVLNAENANAIAAGLLDTGFATTPEDEGTGEQIPDTRVSTIQGRLVALTGLPRPLGASPVSVFGPRGPTAPVSEPAVPAPRRPAAKAEDDGGGNGGFPFLKVLGLFVVAGVVIAIVLRHQRMQRDRLHRQARERHLAEARRRGTLDVVDPEVAADPADVKVVRR